MYLNKADLLALRYQNQTGNNVELRSMKLQRTEMYHTLALEQIVFSFMIWDTSFLTGDFFFNAKRDLIYYET